MLKQNGKIGISLLAALLAMFSVSCNFSRKYEQEQREKIQNYIAEHPEYAFVLKESGLYYCEIVAGSGAAPEQHDTVYVKYTGKFLDGIVFDSNTSTNDTLIFPLGEGLMIPGFEEGISYMHVGGTSLFLMPSDLAYGNSGYLIPGYTPLLFEVKLVKLMQSSGK